MKSSKVGGHTVFEVEFDDLVDDFRFGSLHWSDFKFVNGKRAAI